MESYIDSKKKLYSTIIEFLNESDETNQYSFVQFCENMKDFHIEGDREEMTQFLLIIKNISDNHHRDANFLQKIKEILQQYKDQIKQTLSNEEIFYIFADNKLIVLFLFKSDIINISEEIYNVLLNKVELNGNRYCHFFYPELEQFKGEEEMKPIKEELLTHNPTAFYDFESKRQRGENDSYICSLIQQDLVKEFITYMNRYNISVNSEIIPSIFETNPFLFENKNTTLIEYSAFFGSIQIFQYLLMNNAKLTPSLWLYTIHSKNSELIYLLEANQINPPIFMDDNLDEYGREEDGSFLSCLIESIKCHHNEFAEYIENNLVQKREIELPHTKQRIVSNSIKYHNYSYFKEDLIKGNGFFYLHLYNYKKLFELLFKEIKNDIKDRIIL